MIEPLTSWHLKLLMAVDSAWSWPVEDEKTDPRNKYFVPPSGFFEDHFPELKGQHQLYNLVLKELADKGLLQIKVNTQMVLVEPTAVGFALRKFITWPTED